MAPRKRKQELSGEDILKQMYPDIMTSEDFEQKPQETQQPQQADLMKQISDLNTQIAVLQSQVGQTTKANAALTTRALQPTPPQAPVIDWSKAPNPVDDPEGFTKFNAQAVQAMAQFEKDKFYFEQNQARSTQSRNDQLWESFNEDYKAYAKDPEKVGIAAKLVMEKVIARNQDPDAYMYGQQDRFMSDVAKEMDRLWGKPQLEEDDTTQEEEDEDDPAVVLGGSAQRGNNPAQINKPPERYGALSRAVIDWQTKHGIR